jgi:hypothetical protein
MVECRRIAPVSFALGLALAAATPAAGSRAVSDDPSWLLKPGALKAVIGPFLPVVDASTSDSPDGQAAKLRTAQGCWYGYWRRC